MFQVHLAEPCHTCWEWQVLESFQVLLHEFRSLQQELGPWTAAFQEQHGRKPRLTDVERTSEAPIIPCAALTPALLCPVVLLMCSPHAPDLYSYGPRLVALGGYSKPAALTVVACPASENPPPGFWVV